MYISFFQATPRLSEDKVKQCVDPRLKGEYPPKGVAKVDILPFILVSVNDVFTLIWPSFIDVIPFPWTLPAACCSGSTVCAIRSRVQAQHEHCCEGAFASPSTKTCTRHRRASPATCELNPVTCDGTSQHQASPRSFNQQVIESILNICSVAFCSWLDVGAAQ